MTLDAVVAMEAEAVGSCRLVSSSTMGADSDEEIHFIVYDTEAVVQNGFAYTQRRYTVIVNGVRSTSVIIRTGTYRAADTEGT